MPFTSTSHVTSERASIYLQQLCKHFGHKVSVDFDADIGRIDLPFGTCDLQAGSDVLTLNVTGAEADIARLEKVIGDHLARFAFRENPAIAWTDTA